jgi:glycosyltransferase involved in cell wall biosynthesis
MDSAQHDRLRVLVAVPFTPRVDAMHGGRVIGQFLHELSVRHDLALVYLRRPASDSIDAALAARCDLVEEVAAQALLSGGEWCRRFQVLSGPLMGLPSPIRASYDRRLGEALVRVAKSWRPDVIQLEHDALAQCARAVRDLSKIAILVSHEPGLDAARELAGAVRGRRRLAHLLDAAIWRRYWGKNLSAFDAVVAFTDADRRALEAVGDGVRVVTIPLGIKLPDEPLDPRGAGDSSIVYVGGYRHLPNADAAVRLMRSIAPRIRRQVPSLRVSVVGADPTAEMRAAASPLDDVTGAVPNVDPYLNDAAVVVLPIRLGGGMRVKLLEALAAGKAVVASPRAAAGLELTDGVQIELAETDDEFAAAVVSLLEDESQRVSLAQNARAWAVANLGWGAVVIRYEELYRSLLAAKA